MDRNARRRLMVATNWSYGIQHAAALLRATGRIILARSSPRKQGSSALAKELDARLRGNERKMGPWAFKY